MTLVGGESFIMKTYFVILDNLLCELQKRKSAQCAKKLCDVYPNDLNVNLASEVVQLQRHIKSIEATDNNPKTIQKLINCTTYFLSMASTNYSAERSFSVLKLGQNYLILWSMSQERNNPLIFKSPIKKTEMILHIRYFVPNIKSKIRLELILSTHT
ncbi:zinc finger MYM-type protein 1-like, partial [Aphis craccivora]